MGKSHHFEKYNKYDASCIYSYKLFIVFFMICCLKSKNNSQKKDNRIIEYKKRDEEYSEADKENSGKNNNWKDQSPKVNVLIEEGRASATSEILPLCDTISHTSDSAKEPVKIKVPVVLSEFTAAITIHSYIKLPDNILAVKRIRENVYLNQCKLAPNTESGRPNTSILFIDGIIRENIEYTAKGSSYDEDLKYTSVQVPFKCAARIAFNTCPEFKPAVSQDETEIVGNDSCEQSFRVTESFNEKVFCELLSSEIIGSYTPENPGGKGKYINEKATLFLTLELLQKQHVKIP